MLLSPDAMRRVFSLLSSRARRTRACGFLAALGGPCLPITALSATLAVTNTLDSGPGSFRQAIIDANATNGLDTIIFALPGSPPFAISPVSPLPAMTDPAVIDATSQPGYANQPLIELIGTGAGASAVGLRLGGGGGSTVRGLAINRFDADGIRLESSSNVIQANYIGTDVTGAIARGNGQYGIFVWNVSSNLIGGTNSGDRNVLSGGNDTGIYILNGSENVVQGNHIGVNSTGNAALGNQNHGITLFTAGANTIGGALPGARNLISGNTGSGINLNGNTTTGNVIQGNFIGVGLDGAVTIPNLGDGITLNSAPSTLIGGTNGGEGNLISGNGKAGILLNGASSQLNQIFGNRIGTDATGTAKLGNALAGVTLTSAISNHIGSAFPAARNIISGNQQDGIFFATNSAGNRVQGNFIGVSVHGTNALGNGLNGVAIDSASDNLIGGNETGAGNVISGNTNAGVWLFRAAATNNSVQGNFIGTDSAGRAALRNHTTGVLIEAPGNLIGGSVPGAGNLISGNGHIGVWLLNTNAHDNAVLGNLIGTAFGGTNGLGNINAGVGITEAANNQIGGTAAIERNLISANGFPANNGGVFIVGSKATGNRFFGNFIGTDATGQNPLANRYEGVYVVGGGSNVIGGDVPGAGNLISGNTTRGIRLTNSVGNEIRGNLLGTKLDGITALGNGQFNVELEVGCRNNTVGGGSAGAGNRIAYTGTYAGGPFAGVRVRDAATNNLILGNTIFSNSALGISFSGLAPTANDSCDADGGGNMWQNFPVLSQVYSGANTSVRGYLNSRPNTTFRLQFFANPACESSGNGEGQVYLGEKVVTAQAACSNSFVATLPGAVPVGHVITATATDSANNTSEFSACCSVVPAPVLNITTTADDQLSLSWTSTVTGFVVKETEDLTPPVQWNLVTNAPILSSGRFVITLDIGAGNRFYLLSLE